MNSDVNDEIEKFNIFEVAKKPECGSILKMVLENLNIYNFHIDSQDEDGNTVLHLVVIHQDCKMVQQVMAIGPNFNIPNNVGETPLYLACSRGDLGIVKLLVKSADLNTKDTKSRSVLHIAVEKENLELCKFLLSCGIDVNAQDFNGSTPLHYAIQLKQKKFAILLSQKADINKQDLDGYTPLHVASQTSSDLVKLLVLKNASTTIKTHNGDSPLHLAASSGNFEAVTVLFNGEIKLNSLNNGNYTPLQLAEINGHKKVAQLFSNSANFGPPSKIPRASRARKPHENVNSSRSRIFSLPKTRATVTV